MPQLRLGHFPDPARAHGVWVFLVLSVLAGSLSAAGAGFVPALLAGTGFAGTFLAASALAIGLPAGARRLALGAALALVAPGGALLLGANPQFFAYGLVAMGPALLSAWSAGKHGVQSPMALAMGICALVVAAPSAACAGGATLSRSLVLLGLLLPFFLWRALSIRAHLQLHAQGGRANLRRIGQREALRTAAWTVFSVFLIHLVG